MWFALAVVTFLSSVSGPSGQLELTNVRTTYGILGPPRPNTKFLPGDLFVECFDIEGLKADASGKVHYTIGMEVSDSEGKLVFKQNPLDREAKRAADGKGIPACASVGIGWDQPSGDYTVKVSVTDRAAGSTKELTQRYHLLPRDFGIVHVALTGDSAGRLAAAALRKGQTGYLNFSVVGFERSQVNKQPDVTVVLRVLDEKGRAVLDESPSGGVNRDVPARSHALPMQFAVQINQTGKLKVELVATDKVSGKRSTLSFPLTVSAANAKPKTP
jgi:hypothetical protein